MEKKKWAKWQLKYVYIALFIIEKLAPQFYRMNQMYMKIVFVVRVYSLHTCIIQNDVIWLKYFKSCASRFPLIRLCIGSSGKKNCLPIQRLLALIWMWKYVIFKECDCIVCVDKWCQTACCYYCHWFAWTFTQLEIRFRICPTHWSRRPFLFFFDYSLVNIDD